MTFWSPEEVSDGLADIECVLMVMEKDNVLYVVMDTTLDGYDPAGGSEFSVVTGTLIYRRANEILSTLASFWTCGPLPCEIKLVPQNFTMPFVGGKILHNKIP